MLPASEWLILLGFVCQGYAWESWIASAAYGIVGFLCIRYSRRRKFISDSLEILIFGSGIVLAVGKSEMNPFTCSLNIGHVLFVFQCLRMLGAPPGRRERIMAFLIALIHLVIGSMVILDYSFLLVLIGALYLIPRSLAEIEAGPESPSATSSQLAVSSSSTWGVMAALVSVMIVFFLFFPRRQLSGAASAGLMVPSRAMDSRLDTVGGGSEAQDVILFQIEGEEVEHLKLYALDMFDGNTWSDSWASRKMHRRLETEDSERDLYRRVEIRNPRRFGNALPTDGHVRSLHGNFFPHAILTQQGNVAVPMTWNNGNAHYEYWTTPGPVPDVLTKRERKQLLELPEISRRVHEMVAERVRGKTGDSAIAVGLARYLRENFTYQLGAPDLNRKEPIEDFLFEQKTGHCERFASALAVMLRMAGIPARVVVGYFPTRKNPFADFYNVSVRDGHAWTEAYIEGKGWVLLDATPYLAENRARTPSFVMSVFDWIEYVWYSKIVNYSRTDQKDVASGVFDVARMIYSVCMTRPWIPAMLVVVFVGFGFFRSSGRSRMLQRIRKDRTANETERQTREVRHFYDEMMKLLARSGMVRKPSQTPFEFLHALENENIPCITEIRGITQIFCAVKYGNSNLTQTLRSDVRSMLETITNQITGHNT
jgi:transglutaminase-like putative cysteine protease